MSDLFLELRNVTKRYDQHVAVQNVSMRVPRGKIYGILGPNGAGKTTAIRMITTVTRPDEGEIIFDGQPLREEHAHRTGYMPEERGLYKKMKVRDQVEYLLMLKGKTAREARQIAAEWLDRLGLHDWTMRNTTDLSKGMQQKVQFIATVAHEPDLLVLDEPFSGLDPVNARVIEDEILRLKAKGCTILFSTHRMEQVEEFCDHIGLINRGRLILEDEVGAVRKRFQHNQYELEYAGETLQQAQLPGGFELKEHNDRRALVRLPEGQGMREFMQVLLTLPQEVIRAEQHLPSIKEIFIELVGKDALVAEQRAA